MRGGDVPGGDGGCAAGISWARRWRRWKGIWRATLKPARSVMATDRRWQTSASNDLSIINCSSLKVCSLDATGCYHPGMIDGQLIARKTSDDPIIHRVAFDDGTGPVDVGSIAERTRHTQRSEKYWHWGSGAMLDCDYDRCLTTCSNNLALKPLPNDRQAAVGCSFKRRVADDLTASAKDSAGDVYIWDSPRH